eukprot:1334561-Amorphochlora_amoeboformis.AAC.3
MSETPGIKRTKSSPSDSYSLRHSGGRAMSTKNLFFAVHEWATGTAVSEETMPLKSLSTEEMRALKEEMKNYDISNPCTLSPYVHLLQSTHSFCGGRNPGLSVFYAIPLRHIFDANV